jgi:hypothetical protein
MSSTLALIKKEQPKKPEESDEDYQDRMVEEAYWKLREKKRTKQEEEEYQSIKDKYVALYVVKKWGLAPTNTDADLRVAATRLHGDLTAEYGNSTPTKRMLIDRLVAAWSMAASYERLFQILKYKVDTKGEDTSLSYSHNENTVKVLLETRKGIETANDQIIRLSQTLRNITAPPLHVKAKNAIIAQNMQINQGVSAKNDEKTPT